MPLEIIQVQQLKALWGLLNKTSRYLWRVKRFVDLLWGVLDRSLLHTPWAAQVFRFLRRIERGLEEIQDRVKLARHIVGQVLGNNI
jgi:hypothetical protein